MAPLALAVLEPRKKNSRQSEACLATLMYRNLHPFTWKIIESGSILEKLSKDVCFVLSLNCNEPLGW